MGPSTRPPVALRVVLRRLDLRGTGTGDLRRRLPRPAAQSEPPVDEVRAVLAAVRERGDDALRELTERFDGVRIDDIRVPPEALTAALNAIPAELRAALEVAHANIAAYHEAQCGDEMVHHNGAIEIRELVRPVDRVGCYVPSAAAPLVSTVLMTVVPAKVAGVPEVALVSAPGPDGAVAPGILAAAALAGVDEVYRIGGPAAIAALAYGTDTVRPVDVIVGPGSARVAQAKREVAGSGLVGVPSAFAGPSEVVVVADATTPVDHAAIDVILQAEHGPDGLAWLVTWDEAVADAVTEAVARLVPASPRRRHRFGDRVVPRDQPGQPVGAVLGLQDHVDGGPRGGGRRVGDHHDLRGAGERAGHADQTRRRHLPLGLGDPGAARAHDHVDRADGLRAVGQCPDGGRPADPVHLVDAGDGRRGQDPWRHPAVGLG